MRFKLVASVAATSVLAIAASADGSAVSGTPYLGTWSARISSAQLAAAGQDTRLAGTFRLILRKKGTYTTSNSLDGASSGKFRVSGHRIVFFDDVGCTEGGFVGKGSYTWSIRKGKLRIRGVSATSDPCGGRRQTLEYPVWRKA
jgi:hypothetical protein